MKDDLPSTIDKFINSKKGKAFTKKFMDNWVKKEKKTANFIRTKRFKKEFSLLQKDLKKFIRVTDSMYTYNPITYSCRAFGEIVETVFANYVATNVPGAVFETHEIIYEEVLFSMMFGQGTAYSAEGIDQL